MEEWKPIKGYEGVYEINETGQVKSLPRLRYCGVVGSEPQMRSGRILSTTIDRLGYPRVKLSQGGKSKLLYTHRLLANNFIKNPEGYKEINHIDGVKTNNSLDNLEWTTRSENMKHGFKLGLMKSREGESNNLAKLKEDQVLEVRRIFKESNLTQIEIGKMFKVSSATISDIVNHKTWNHI